MSGYGIYYVPSSRIPGLKYKVLVGPTGAACSCPWGIGNRSRAKPCRHIKEILEEFDMTSTAVALRVERPVATLPTRAEMESMDFIAAQLADKGLIAVPAALRGPENAGVRRAIIFAGYELGVRPMTALRHMIPVEGTIEPDGQLMVAICTSREPDITFVTTEDTAEAVTVRLTRPKKGIVAEYRCTQADIDRAGLANKDNHKKWPRQMKRWQCCKNLGRAYCADLINGVESFNSGAFVAPEQPAPITDRNVVEGEVITPSDLYNEGDREDDGETPPSIEEQQAAVETLTKAVKEKAAASEAKPTATREQLASIREWNDALKEKTGAGYEQAVETFNAWLVKSFPYAMVSGRFTIQNLTETDMDRVIKAMKEFVETAAIPADEEAPFE